MSRFPRLVVFAGLLIVAAACEGTREGASTATVRDSAGIRIAEVRLPEDRVGADWSIADNPSVSIGKVEGEESFLFERIASAFSTRDGGIVVANSGMAPGLRFFDSLGNHVRTAGGQGEGPGEFIHLYRALPYRSDSIAVFDDVLRRISIFDEAGVLGRSAAFPSALGRLEPAPRKALPDGGFVLIRTAYNPARPNYRDGWERTHAIRTNHLLTIADTLLELPLGRMEMDPHGYGHSVDLGGSGQYLDDEDGFIWLRTDIGELRRFDHEGHIRGIIRLLGSRVPVTDALWERLTEARMEVYGTGNPEGARLYRESLENAPRASHAPLIWRVLRDSEGNLWVCRYRFPWEGAETYHVLDPTHGWIATVTFPEGVFVREIGRDYVLLTRRDELDVSYVQLHVLRR